MTTLGELLTDKEFIASTNIERALYDVLIKYGVKESDVIACGKYDKQVGDAKERIYKEFSKLLGFEYYWESYYHIKEVGKK